MKVLLPFKLTSIPLTKLALISFEKDPDTVYRGLELQYLDGLPHGTGWRIIAYRNDSYVDVYDEHALHTVDNERFDVAEKGLKYYTKTRIDGVTFEKDEYGVHICFTFQDRLNRSVLVEIHEKTTRNSTAMNLLAPIGAGSENPTSLPLFFLYDFDFVRKANTVMIIEIDGKRRRADPFPFPIPKEFQWRYYTRYSMDCHIVEFAKADNRILNSVELSQDHTYTDGQTTYTFDCNEQGIALSSIILEDTRHSVKIVFENPLPVESGIDGAMEGNFHVTTDPIMGTVDGTYQWKLENGVYNFTLSPDGGWSSVPNSFLTKMILSRKSVFSTWPKTYQYEQEIQMDSLQSQSEWKRIK